ncbi:hypothetical protein GQ55_1G050500 [Panicum hallii var. hallii]|uniref:DUF4220 domain-containing protein n=1 Tax=Panicum hallii var. hallii TaxID=1504633 RepID=A0A2T7F2G3_9POAL|nr:hypothetical protein GQ55_1G050500 [Panicum hallii var. hallii]
MVSFLTQISQFWRGWGLQIAVYVSLGAHIILIVLARSRRHGTSRLATGLLWLAYQAAEVSAFYALGDLSLSGCDDPAASRQQQLVAFWAPFMLLHLGGPDNITAYALEDNTLSWRKGFEMATQFLSSFFTLYNYVYLTGSGVLLPASAMMAAAGVARYLEKSCALLRGDLSKMKKSSRRRITAEPEPEPEKKPYYYELNLLSAAGGGGDNERALVNAHRLFPCCKRAMFDSSVDMEMDAADHFPKEMRAVVEMELSLVYDILYTKAAVIHTWHGYLVRLVSPLLTGAGAVLFGWFYPKHDLEPRDVRFTYVMLASAFLLDVMWLLRALASYWAYPYLRNPRSMAAWLLPHAVRHGGWCPSCCWLHRAVACLDPCRWLCGKYLRSYRRWSGVAGRWYNLLHECAARAGASPSGWLEKKKEHQYLGCLFESRQGVEEMLFQRIRQRLLPLCKPDDSAAGASSSNEEAEHYYTMKRITTEWGRVALERRGPMVFKEDQKPYIGLEFQEDVLVWHIGTFIFLWHLRDHHQLINERYMEAIELVSEYLMFLVALRPHMLPGFVLRSLLETTCDSLGTLYHIIRKGEAQILYNKIPRGKERKHNKTTWGADKAKTRLISDGILLARTLLKPIQRKNPKPENPETLLELIFDVWVDKLIYAGTKCSRESHAKQLSRGGELTTIVWMIVEHVGTFRIGEKIKPKDRRTPLRRPTLPMPMPPPRPPSAYLPWWATQLPFPPATSPQFP